MQVQLSTPWGPSARDGSRPWQRYPPADGAQRLAGRERHIVSTGVLCRTYPANATMSLEGAGNWQAHITSSGDYSVFRMPSDEAVATFHDCGLVIACAHFGGAAGPLGRAAGPRRPCWQQESPQETPAVTTRAEDITQPVINGSATKLPQPMRSGPRKCCWHLAECIENCFGNELRRGISCCDWCQTEPRTVTLGEGRTRRRA